MGGREIIITGTASEQIAAVSWFIESKGLTATAERFTDEVYDFFIKLSDTKRSYALCHEPSRKALGYKCIPYLKKYTIVFIETEMDLTILEFIASKLIYW